jgi:amino acid adenylation domain-containing protein
VLKAGCAYVPLDPLHPHKRQAFMLADSRPRVLLTQVRLADSLPLHACEVMMIDAETSASPGAAASAPASDPSDLAYVIYTSGSTGEPKGVQVEHRSVVNMLSSMQRRPGLRAEDRMLALTTLTFDISVLEIFLPLVSGASVVIAPAGAALDGEALMALLERTGVSVMQATPASLRMLLDAGWEGAPDLKILCGGEAWDAALAGQLQSRCGSLWNMYGPTETTVWSATTKIEPGQPVVIGSPIANTRLYVLDSAAQLMPVGLAGELYIGGEGLARSYFERPELTRERFVSDRFSPTPGARMYRTGDLVRRLIDGSLEFLGRLDHQVKIRGHRIELGEIETALSRHPLIEQCVVMAREDDEPGDQRLVAYVVATDGVTPPLGDLRALLGETLPAYMIPSHFVPMAAFPLTPNGKLDRKALPTPESADDVPEIGAVGPRTPTEEILARIWREMLGLKQVDVRDNFFELGGHSLLAARMIGRINQTLGVRLPVPAFFQNPTIEGLARVLSRRDDLRPDPKLAPLQSGERGPPVYFIGAGPAEIQIAQLMGEDRAVYALDIPMPAEWRRAIAKKTAGALPTLEELGELYSDLLRDHAGSSPCVVAGYSLWGTIAFEAARALQRAGGTVAFVLLLDARALYRRRTFSGAAAESWRWIWNHRMAAKQPPDTRELAAPLADSLRLAAWMLARVPKVVKTRLTPDTNLSGYIDRDGVPIYQKVINGLTRIVGQSYRPTPLNAPGVLIRAEFPGEDRLPGYDFTNGWGPLFLQGLETLQAKGDHVTMVDEKNLEGLAELINGKLDRYVQAEAAAARGSIRA